MERNYKHSGGREVPTGLPFQEMAKPPNLYPGDEIRDAMEKRRKAEDLSVEQAAEMAGMGSAASWYKKVQGATPFKVEEIGLFAAAIGAAPGWPFIEWSAAKWLEKELEKRKATEH